MTDSLLGEILKQLCYHRVKLLIMFGFLATLLLLTIAGFSVLRSGTATYVVNTINLVALSVLLVLDGVLLVVCFKTDFRFR